MQVIPCDRSPHFSFHERLSGKAVAGVCPPRDRTPVVSDRAAGYQVAGAIEWLCSLRRLCEAAISRHSDLTAALPLRWKRSIRRLALICPNTGSMLFALG